MAQQFAKSNPLAKVSCTSTCFIFLRGYMLTLQIACCCSGHSLLKANTQLFHLILTVFFISSYQQKKVTRTVFEWIRRGFYCVNTMWFLDTTSSLCFFNQNVCHHKWFSGNLYSIVKASGILWSHFLGDTFSFSFSLSFHAGSESFT